mmetsp:Transcript_74238/g.188420  ORF Transcript_74238/g.188420 Transcript_74238/m.188420 type:complete len:289 (+) Transcript_74238:400-1266(+)
MRGYEQPRRSCRACSGSSSSCLGRDRRVRSKSRPRFAGAHTLQNASSTTGYSGIAALGTRRCCARTRLCSRTEATAGLAPSCRSRECGTQQRPSRSRSGAADRCSSRKWCALLRSAPQQKGGRCLAACSSFSRCLATCSSFSSSIPSISLASSIAILPARTSGSRSFAWPRTRGTTFASVGIGRFAGPSPTPCGRLSAAACVGGPTRLPGVVAPREGRPVRQQNSLPLIVLLLAPPLLRLIMMHLCLRVAQGLASLRLPFALLVAPCLLLVSLPFAVLRRASRTGSRW